jgi:hypothetical protein
LCSPIFSITIHQQDNNNSNDDDYSGGNDNDDNTDNNTMEISATSYGMFSEDFSHYEIYNLVIIEE